MRKADYCALARIIRETRAQAYETCAHPGAAADRKTAAEATFAAAYVIADRFATLAHVDKVPFLQECGILRR
jgi:hypothetical protein